MIGPKGKELLDEATLASQGIKNGCKVLLREGSAEERKQEREVLQKEAEERENLLSGVDLLADNTGIKEYDQV